MKTVVLLLVTGLVILLVALSMFFISPIDVFTGKVRVVAKQQLANGDTIEIIQYWNNGDFYNLDLRHITSAGAQYECVIDPDCNRIPRCQLNVDPANGEVTVTAGSPIWARYKPASKELLRKNGLLVEADLMR